MRWIESTGGPLVISAIDGLCLWSGIFKINTLLRWPNSEIDEENDYKLSHYGSACRIQDYIGTVSVAGYDFLVLADEPLSTSYFKAINDLFIVRIYHLNLSLVELDQSLNRMVEMILQWKECVQVRFESNTLKLFDASMAGLELSEGDSLDIEIENGEYAVSTGFYEDENVRLIVHRAVLL